MDRQYHICISRRLPRLYNQLSEDDTLGCQQVRQCGQEDNANAQQNHAG